MLRIDSKNMNFNGTSMVNGLGLASLSASVNDPDNNAYVSINVMDMSSARTNLAALKADVAAFLDEIAKLPEEEEE